ncbi:MAG TPA: putative peptidoglycan glycosyltransferase FtsW [Candidatus Hydrogenedentes bacterium]|nr:putative peptidoglycan glycosyltransferase FtsW [Candidatus Hydrogenedentota bacterium]
MKGATAVIALSAVGLCLLGAVLIYSVDSARPEPEGVFIKHCATLLIASVLFLFFAFSDYHLLGRRWVWLPFALVSVALLIAVLFIGREVGGAVRWIRIFGFGFQPSEVARFALIAMLAAKLSEGMDQIRSIPRVILPALLTASLFAGLVFLEKDIGIPFMMMVTAGAMLIFAGLPLLYVAVLGVAGSISLIPLILFAAHRVERFRVLLDPWQDRSGSGWQLIQALYSFSRGGLFGTGLGSGTQKLGDLPAADTDFIFATIGEELGLIGTISVLLVFLVFFWAAMRVCVNSPDRLGMLLSGGIGISIGVQALFIILVNIGLLPTKGLPLPFVSSGGTSLLITMAMTGVLVNVASQCLPREARYALPTIEIQEDLQLFPDTVRNY